MTTRSRSAAGDEPVRSPHRPSAPLPPTLVAGGGRAGGLKVERLHYVNCIGLLGWYVAVKGLRGRPKAGLLMTVNDRAVVPWLSRLEALIHPPFGQSLFLVASKG